MKRQDSLLRRIEMAETLVNPSDRRSSPRYPAVRNRAILAWRETEESEIIQSSARLLNISNSGVLLLVEERPKSQQTAWVRLEEPAPTEWLEVAVVNSRKIHGLLWFRKTSYLIRLRFTLPCPYHLFKSATHGLQLDTSQPVSHQPEDDDRYWR